MDDYVRISVERYEELREKEKAVESEMIKITGNYEYIYSFFNTEIDEREPNAIYLGKDVTIAGLVKDNIAKANALNEARKQHKKNKLELEAEIKSLIAENVQLQKESEYYKKHRFFRDKKVVEKIIGEERWIKL